MAGMATLSRRLLDGADAEAIVRRRRANYAHLAVRVGALRAALPTVAALRPTLPDGARPLVFPMRLHGGRDEAAAALYRRGVAVRTLWDVLPREIPLDRFPESPLLRDEILCLPFHQDLSPRQLDRAVAALAETVAALPGEGAA